VSSTWIACGISHFDIPLRTSSAIGGDIVYCRCVRALSPAKNKEADRGQQTADQDADDPPRNGEAKEQQTARNR
jgi:hypothetical protein